VRITRYHEYSLKTLAALVRQNVAYMLNHFWLPRWLHRETIFGAVLLAHRPPKNRKRHPIPFPVSSLSLYPEERRRRRKISEHGGG
jgi:hypothetical protein